MSPEPKQSDRATRLAQLRQTKMARSAHSYVRGNTVQFYDWLNSGKGQEIPAGPMIWICGDCHLGNLGPVSNSQGDVEIEIRDLDQTVIGSPAHDIVRLSLSLAMAARGSDLPGVTTASILEEVIGGYVEGLISPKRKTKVESKGAIDRVLKEATRRRWRHLATERIENVKPTIPLGRRFWKLSREERQAINELFTEDSIRSLLANLKGRDERAKIEVLDAAYWVKGCSSLGRLRVAVLVALGKRTQCLVDIKEATKPAAPRSAKSEMPASDAERVVAGARNLSPYLGERMVSANILKKQIVVRELLPQDLKLEMGRITQADAVAASRYLAATVGRAHGRQMVPADRRKWRDQIQGKRSKDLNAPTWLWRSVVDLIGSHEMAYLEHCRNYVLTNRR